MSARAWRLRRDGAAKPLGQRGRAGVSRAEWARRRRLAGAARIRQRRVDRIPGQVKGFPRGWQHLGWTTDAPFTVRIDDEPGSAVLHIGPGRLWVAPIAAGSPVSIGPAGTSPWLLDPRPPSPTRGLHITGL